MFKVVGWANAEGGNDLTCDECPDIPGSRRSCTGPDFLSDASGVTEAEFVDAMAEKLAAAGEQRQTDIQCPNGDVAGRTNTECFCAPGSVGYLPDDIESMTSFCLMDTSSLGHLDGAFVEDFEFSNYGIIAFGGLDTTATVSFLNGGGVETDSNDLTDATFEASSLTNFPPATGPRTPCCSHFWQSAIVTEDTVEVAADKVTVTKGRVGGYDYLVDGTVQENIFQALANSGVNTDLINTVPFTGESPWIPTETCALQFSADGIKAFGSRFKLQDGCWQPDALSRYCSEWTTYQPPFNSVSDAAAAVEATWDTFTCPSVAARVATESIDENCAAERNRRPCESTSGCRWVYMNQKCAAKGAQKRLQMSPSLASGDIESSGGSKKGIVNFTAIFAILACLATVVAVVAVAVGRNRKTVPRPAPVLDLSKNINSVSVDGPCHMDTRNSICVEISDEAEL
jgi:hypothetical protein